MNTPAPSASPAGFSARTILKTIAVVLVVALALWLLLMLRGVLLAVVLAVFFAYLVAPLLELRGVRRLPRWAAVALIYGVLFGGAALALSLLMPRIGRQASEMGAQAPAYLSSLHDQLHALTARFDQANVPPAVRATLQTASARAVGAAGQVADHVLGMLLGFLSFLPWLFIIPIISFFLLNEAASFRETALHLLPEGRARWRGAELVDEINRTLAFYVRAQLLACAIIGVECFLGYAALRVPYALVLGLAAALLEFVPMVGPFVADGAAVLLARTHSTSLALATLGFVLLVRAVHNYAVYPRLIARGTRLHPLAIILSILCGAELGGVAGLFLAIPLTAVLSVAYRYVMLQLGSEGLVQTILHVEEPPDVAAVATPSPPNPAAESPRLLSPGEGPLGGVNILVVDNEDDARGMLVAVLQRAGAHVWDVGSVPEALDLVARYRPDLLLSDIGMPGQDGFDLIRQLRASDVAHGGETPAAALTAYITDEDRERTLKAGFQAHLDKPVNVTKLVDTIVRLTRKGVALAG